VTPAATPAAGSAPGSGAPARPFFVVGCPRSGTTLVQLMLHAHPRLAVPPETRFLVRAYRARARFGDLRRASRRRRLARWVMRRPQSADLGLDPDEVVAAVEAAPPTLGSALGAVFGLYAARQGKPRWGDKRPGHWRDLDVLLRLFPDAQLVHVVRDGRACVASLKAMPWWAGGVPAATAVWLQSHRRWRRDTRGLPADRVHTVRYEELVADPEPVLRRLCAFLGEEFDPAMTAPQEVAAATLPSYKTWHARTTGAVDTAAVEAWRDALTPEELGLVELVAGRRLAALGYRRSAEGRRPSPRAVAAVAREYADRAWLIRRARVTDAWRRRRERRPLAALSPSARTPSAESKRGRADEV
jgi:hypothetical protein